MNICSLDTEHLLRGPFAGCALVFTAWCSCFLAGREGGVQGAVGAAGPDEEVCEGGHVRLRGDEDPTHVRHPHERQ